VAADPHAGLSPPPRLAVLFGPRSYALLRHQDLLPAVLVEVVRRLLRA
jgi:hypothetical protein